MFDCDAEVRVAPAARDTCACDSCPLTSNSAKVPLTEHCGCVVSSICEELPSAACRDHRAVVSYRKFSKPLLNNVLTFDRVQVQK